MRWRPLLRLAAAILIWATLATAVLALRMMNDNRRWAAATSNSIMSYSLAEQTLQVDLLNARAGLLRNYDPVNADLVSASDSLAKLERLPMRQAARDVLAEIKEAAARQEALVEQFKSRNALLQNSLTRFTANGSAEIGDHNVLSAWILKLTLDTSAATVAQARSALKDLPRGTSGTPAAQLVSHARLLVAVLPEIDKLLHSIRAMRMPDRVGRLETLLREEAADRANALWRLQVSFGVSIALLTAVVTSLILIHRQRTQELEAQADNERLSAAIAMPLIDTGHATFAGRVQEAVDRLGSHLGARRLRLTIPGAPDPAHFSAGGNDDDQQWFCRLVQVAEANGAWIADRVIASTHPEVGHPALIMAMREAGIQNLVLLRTAGPFRVTIGFEPEGAAFAQRQDHLAGIASAIAAIAHGARREVLQLERERLELTVARAGRMEMIGAMASGVAHNFNNIIGAIGGFAEMGQGRTRRGSPVHRHFEEIRKAVERARDLVDEILRFGRQGRSTKHPVELLNILRETVRLLSASAPACRESFVLLTSDEALHVIGAESELQQVFLNIANNAAHASDSQHVTIHAKRASLAESRQLSHGRLGPGKYVVVSICDRGPGIPAAAWQRLFEPFFTMKAGGTGLGLSTAWEVVQDHGGTIAVENLAQGARFSVWLPESIAPAIRGDGVRILLLGDPGQLPADQELLAEIGYEPTALPLPAGVATLSGIQDEFDAVLIASSRSESVGKLASQISKAAAVPVLIAAPEAILLGSPALSAKLSYPLRRDELIDLLPKIATKRVLFGIG